MLIEFVVKVQVGAQDWKPTSRVEEKQLEKEARALVRTGTAKALKKSKARMRLAEVVPLEEDVLYRTNTETAWDDVWEIAEPEEDIDPSPN